MRPRYDEATWAGSALTGNVGRGGFRPSGRGPIGVGVRCGRGRVSALSGEDVGMAGVALRQRR
jgi:hypothetical protein